MMQFWSAVGGTVVLTGIGALLAARGIAQVRLTYRIHTEAIATSQRNVLQYCLLDRLHLRKHKYESERSRRHVH